MSETKTPHRIVLHPEADGVAIVFPPERNPAVVGFGPLKPGVVYVVSPAEAARLTGDERSASHRFDLADTKAIPKKAASSGEKE